MNFFFHHGFLILFALSLSLFLYFFSQYDFICVSVLFLLSAQSLSQVSQFVSEANARTTFSQPKPSADVTFQKRTFRLARCLSFRFATASIRLINDQCDKIWLELSPNVGDILGYLTKLGFFEMSW